MTNLYDQIIDFTNIEKAYKQTQKGARKFRKDSILFGMYKEMNLVDLWRDLKTGKYRVGEYIRFKVYEPKERIVSAPRIRDKIVQFAAHTVIKDIYKPVFIKDSYACLEGRGTHRAVDAVQRYMRACKRKYGDGWIVKVDVSKFFYSIDRDILKRILRKKIKCRKTLWLLDMIIDSSPEGEAGIPLGNVTSQDFANIYLNEVDQYVKRYLGVRWYVRYMDDMIAVVPTREEAKELKNDIVRFLRERLNLSENPKKSQIFPLKNGVNAYGFKIWTTHRLVRDQSKRAMKRRIKAMDRKLKARLIRKQDVQQAVNSWLGHARHSNSYNLAKKIFERYPYIKVEGEMQFGSRVLGRRRIGRSL
ncbi:group II intron reverse transcriptase domain-containing protein [Brevibacillus agri]|uniref:reverse transcriptase/maturase family protein n=1 Tax=Brevibacillus agri TaxID=51101 RepID=UPI001C8EB558|nr:reverse transcriptase/maturase family protein [Brevibacillus agri]MBY0055187.1 group II intron reverse transcriptase domain-containing protein [Brevibacillus agri]